MGVYGVTDCRFENSRKATLVYNLAVTVFWPSSSMAFTRPVHLESTAYMTSRLSSLPDAFSPPWEWGHLHGPILGFLYKLVIIKWDVSLVTRSGSPFAQLVWHSS